MKNYVYILISIAALFSSSFGAHQMVNGRHSREKIILPDDALTGVRSTIQSAVDALCSSGGLIHLSSGIYTIEDNLDKAITINNCDNISIEGEGNSTKFVSAGTSTGANAYFYVVDSDGIKFTNINFTGNELFYPTFQGPQHSFFELASAWPFERT